MENVSAQDNTDGGAETKNIYSINLLSWLIRTIPDPLPKAILTPKSTNVHLINEKTY